MPSTLVRPPSPATSVLLVEHDAIIRLDLAAELEGCGFSVIEAFEAAGALEAFRAEHVDAVVIDADLPGRVSGHEVVQAIRDQRPDCPVIMLTGRTPLFPSSFDQHVIIEGKPFRPEKIAFVIQSLAHRTGSVRR